MFFLLLYIFGVFVALIGAGWAAISDIRYLKIPNTVSVLGIAGFALSYIAVVLSGQDSVFSNLYGHLISAGMVFVITLILYVFKLFGAGDAKMASAYALWFSLYNLPGYLVIMTLVGGLLGVVSLVLRKASVGKLEDKSAWVAGIRRGDSAVPYGVAIAASAIITFITSGLLNMGVFKLFIE
tara:strand:+ start:892 stop:1437 length:546 start_codon:yes stop_codon:yes gene_type:complete